MSAKVLKIDVLVDENGHAERKLESLDKKVDGLTEGATRANAPIDRLSKSVHGLGDETEDLGAGLTTTNAAFGLGTPVIGGYTVGMLAAGAAAAAFIVSAAALGAIIRTSTEHYIEQSGVLEVNSDAVDRLAESWDRAKFRIGEATLGTSGDFSVWIELVNGGLTIMSQKLADGIRFWKELAELSGDLATSGLMGLMFGAEGAPGADTRRSDINGDDTAFGRMQRFWDNQKKLREQEQPGFGKGGFQQGMEEWNRLDREAAEEAQAAEREWQKLARESERYLQEKARMHRQLADELHRVQDAARQAFDAEIASAFMRQLGQINGLAQDMRDDFASLVLSGRELKQFQIDERADRAMAGVDPRAENAGDLQARIQAQRELQTLMLRKESEGMNDALHTDIMIFREKYAEVLSGLPATVQSAFAEMTGIAHNATEQMATDVETMGSRATQTFQVFAMQIKSSAQLLQESALLAFDAEQNLINGSISMGWFGFEAARSKREQAGRAGYRESVLGFANGGVVPLYAAGGAFVPRGTDTVPAMLTPGEGVLSRRGMDALDRLNRGGGMGGVTVTVDARGATVDSDARMNQMAEVIQRKIQSNFERVSA